MNSIAMRRARQAARRRTLQLLALRRAEAAVRGRPGRLTATMTGGQVRPGRREAGTEG
ncbi:hypothetical protein HD601_001949 [Jiangella mangrovi]|uniref:Uncharacterized protein n=1 Tax=Jiangella mangrovi TaxID=1524084 RepID=A0A7W9GPD4_9ACTN|nr:hypothetical protein [Jiangella mangrovi]